MPAPRGMRRRSNSSRGSSRQPHGIHVICSAPAAAAAALGFFQQNAIKSGVGISLGFGESPRRGGALMLCVRVCFCTSLADRAWKEGGPTDWRRDNDFPLRVIVCLVPPKNVARSGSDAGESLSVRIEVTLSLALSERAI